MTWAEVRRHYPGQWLLVEAIQAHSAAGQRIVEDLAVVETYPDGSAALKGYAHFRRRWPWRELLPIHTAREQLDIDESVRLSFRVVE